MEILRHSPFNSYIVKIELNPRQSGYRSSILTTTILCLSYFTKIALKNGPALENAQKMSTAKKSLCRVHLGME